MTPTAGQAPRRPLPPCAARTPTQHLSLARLAPLTVLLATGLALLLNSCADHRDTNASTQCEVTVSTQLFRSDQAKIDREVIRRVSRDMRAGREIIWRDAYFQGRRLSRTKVLCLDLPSGGLAFRVLERHRD